MMSCLSTHGEASNEGNEKKHNAKHSKAESVVFVSSSKKVAQTFLIRTLSPLTLFLYAFIFFSCRSEEFFLRISRVEGKHFSGLCVVVLRGAV